METRGGECARQMEASLYECSEIKIMDLPWSCKLRKDDTFKGLAAPQRETEATAALPIPQRGNQRRHLRLVRIGPVYHEKRCALPGRPEEGREAISGG